MQILVTGGAGYIGSVLVEKLLSKGFKVSVIDNLMYRQTSLAHLIRNPNFTFHYGDVRDTTKMSALIKTADVVIPLAAIVGAPACAKDELLSTSVNRDSVIQLFKMLGKNQIVLMPTTNSAYGKGGPDGFCDEESTLNPISLYAKDKVQVETELLKLPNATSFRLATAFGVSPRMRLDLLVNNFVFKALTDRYLVVFEGHFRRNYIHLHDISQAFLLALSNFDSFRGEIFNVGLSSANLTKIELCKLISEEVADFVFYEAEVGSDPDQRDYLVSNSKIESRGFSPEISLREGVRELIRAYSMFNQQPFTNL
jgi:nucleoside-diphosphate-sugar epimerase